MEHTEGHPHTTINRSITLYVVKGLGASAPAGVHPSDYLSRRVSQMWENAAPKAPEVFFLGLPHVSILQNAQISVEGSNLGEKHETNPDPLTRPPGRPLAAGPSICHLSLEGGGGGQRCVDSKNSQTTPATTSTTLNTPIIGRR